MRIAQKVGAINLAQGRPDFATALLEKIAALQKRAEDPSQAGEIDWPEAIEGDEIDLGPLVYETLATSLDPYPKKAEADFKWSNSEQSGETPKNNPFSVLKGLKSS